MNKKRILNSIDEIESVMTNDFRVTDEVKDSPWCWINSKGKIIQCDFQAHDLKIMELFTDEYNLDHADYALSSKLVGLNIESFIENHWVRVSAEIISLPIKFTVRQKLAIENIVSKYPQIFFKEKSWFSCFPMKQDSNKSYVLIYENNKVKWEIS